MCEVMYASGVRENADVVMCNEFINDKKCSILMENCVLSKNDIERKILPDFFAKKTDDTYQMGVTVWWHVYTKIFRRQFIEKSGLCFDTQLYSGEDFLYSLKSLCLAEKLVCIFDAHCYHYMIRSSSITQNYRYGFIEKNFKIFSEINNCVTDNQNLFERINFYIIIAAADMINNELLKSHLNKKEKIKRLDLIAKSPEIKAAVQNVSKDKLSFQYRGYYDVLLKKSGSEMYYALCHNRCYKKIKAKLRLKGIISRNKALENSFTYARKKLKRRFRNEKNSVYN